MPLFFRYFSRSLCKLSNFRCYSTILSSKHFTLVFNPIIECHINYTRLLLNSSIVSSIENNKISHRVENRRYYAKKKGSKREIEEEEESDDEVEESETFFDNESENFVTKSVASMRFDTIIKAALSMSKKRIETSFYASKFRINNEPVLKKAQQLYVGDEIDLIRGYSPESNKLLLVDKVIIKSTGKVTGGCLIPVKMEIFKELTIENYENPWAPSSLSQRD